MIYEYKITPDQDVIESIRDLLARAEAGEILSYAAIYSMPDYGTGNIWAGMDKNNMAMVGECVALQQELVNYFIELRSTAEEI